MSKNPLQYGRVASLANAMESSMDYENIADYLSNSADDSQDSISDLANSDTGLNMPQAKRLLSSWYKLDAKERNKMSFSTRAMVDWIKQNLK